MKQFIAAADSFAAWNKAGGKVLPGLTRRRAAEKKLFLT
jgi:lysozyme